MTTTIPTPILPPLPPHHQHRVVTQILTRPSTTITALVTLGDGPTDLPPPLPTTTSSIPTESSQTISAAPSSSTLTREQLAALLGSVFGLAFLFLLICCGLFTFRRRQRQRYYARNVIYYDPDMDGASSEENGSVHVQQAAAEQTRYYSTQTWNRTDRRREKERREREKERERERWRAYVAAAAAAGGGGGGGATAGGGGGAAGAGGTWTTVPPPVRFPPTPRNTGTPYRQTRYPQMPGVTRYP